MTKILNLVQWPERVCLCTGMIFRDAPRKSIILNSLVGRESRQISCVDRVAQSGDKDPPVAPPHTHSLHHNTTLRPLQNPPWSPSPRGRAAPEPSANGGLQKKMVSTLKSQLLFCWEFNMLPVSHENTKIKTSMWRTLVFGCKHAVPERVLLCLTVGRCGKQTARWK